MSDGDNELEKKLRGAAMQRFLANGRPFTLDQLDSPDFKRVMGEIRDAMPPVYTGDMDSRITAANRTLDNAELLRDEELRRTPGSPGKSWAQYTSEQEQRWPFGRNKR